MSPRVTLFTDVISPYAWLAMVHLDRLDTRPEVTIKPILFAGLLNHWGHKGPAEIPEKKTFTFRYVKWIADRQNVDLNLPPHHPFNPLRALRLAISLGATHDVMMKLFRAIWVDGNLPDDEAGWSAIKSALNCADGDERIADPDVKAALLTNGDDAIALGVFGVPTFCVDEELFWGADAMDMMQDYLADPDGFRSHHAGASRLIPSSVRKS
jgi:2-hydroxychromene-2-carboxylate isomerase